MEVYLFAFATALLGIGGLYIASKRIPQSPHLVNALFRFFSLFQQKRNPTIRKITLGVFLSGTLIYIIGFTDPEVFEDLDGKSWIYQITDLLFYGISLFLRSMVSALGMFVSHSDLIEVNHLLHVSPVYMIPFTIIHCAAIVLSIGFILSFVSYRLKARLKMESWMRDHKDVYIFWGMNSPSLRLAESLEDDAQMVFITEDDPTEKKIHRLSFEHLLDTSHESSIPISFIESLGGIIIPYEKQNTAYKLKDFVLHGKNLRFILFTDNETFNLSRASNILSSEILKDCKEHIFTYCHARKEIINMTLLDNHDLQHELNVVNDQHLKLIDSAHMAVELLKSSPEAQPIQFVDLETQSINGTIRSTGRVKSAFHSLLIGFGETGQEALSFLYEFGAFTGLNGKRSPFKCLAVDQYMDEIEGTFYAKRPGLRYNPDIQLEKATVGSLHFWDLIESQITDLNYVVISLGNDKLNTQIAVELYDHILWKNGRIPKHFVIYVRLNKRRKKELQGICSLYFNNEYGDETIRFFGAEEDIFSASKVIQNLDEVWAQNFNEQLNIVYQKYQPVIPIRTTKDEDEDENNLLIRMKDKQRFETQRLSNVKHIFTLIQFLTNRNHYEDILQTLAEAERKPSLNNYKGSYWYVEKDDFYARLMQNLAECEHLRWMASYEMLGYAPSSSCTDCNIRERLHPGMVSWEDLKHIWCESNEDSMAEYTHFSYNVIETSIKIYLQQKTTL